MKSRELVAAQTTRIDKSSSHLPRGRGRVVKRRMYRPKRSQEERRQTTQASILEAAMKVLLQRGYANFTTAEVAASAGVSRGAQMNYFRTRQDLILATGRYTLARSREDALAFAKASTSSRHTLEGFLKNAERFFLGQHYTAMMEVTLAARTDPKIERELGTLLTQYRRMLNSIWVNAFVQAGYDRKRAENLVRLTNHLYRGMALTAVWARDKKEDRMVRKLWARLAKDLLERGRI
jgi:AcrR family transcriptional regulator